MRTCPDCGAKFTFKERIKAFNGRYNEIKCSGCKAIYRKDNRLINGIVTGISVFLTINISSLIKGKLEEFVHSYLLFLILVFCIGFFMNILLNSFVKYRRVE